MMLFRGRESVIRKADEHCIIDVRVFTTIYISDLLK